VDLDEALTQLYGLRPDEFLPARRRLALAAKSGGDPGLAKAIDSVRKPTAASDSSPWPPPSTVPTSASTARP